MVFKDLEVKVVYNKEKIVYPSMPGFTLKYIVPGGITNQELKDALFETVLAISEAYYKEGYSVYFSFSRIKDNISDFVDNEIKDPKMIWDEGIDKFEIKLIRFFQDQLRYTMTISR